MPGAMQSKGNDESSAEAEQEQADAHVATGFRVGESGAQVPVAAGGVTTPRFGEAVAPGIPEAGGKYLGGVEVDDCEKEDEAGAPAAVLSKPAMGPAADARRQPGMMAGGSSGSEDKVMRGDRRGGRSEHDEGEARGARGRVDRGPLPSSARACCIADGGGAKSRDRPAATCAPGAEGAAGAVAAARQRRS